MALIRWYPARELDGLHGEIGRLFGSVFDTHTSPSANRRPGPWVPPMDVIERDDHFLLLVDLPGMDQKDVEIELRDDTLTLAGERRSFADDEDTLVRRLERGSGRFERTLRLPEGVDPDSIRASFSQGQLEVRIPKPEARRPRKVMIEVGSNDAARSEDVEGSAS